MKSVSFVPLMLALLGVGQLFVSAQESWEDDLHRFSQPVTVTIEEGFRSYALPAATESPFGEGTGPKRFLATGFVVVNGVRYYVPEENYQRWQDRRIPPIWISADGKEILPALPKLREKIEGIDPYSGEPVMVEIYEETVEIQEIHEWPAESDAGLIDRFFPLAVLEVDTTGESLLVDFQPFPNGDSIESGYPFYAPSFRQQRNGVMQAMRRLVSRPDRAVIRLKLSQPGAFSSGMEKLMQPGLVFLGHFKHGKLVQLSIGGDAWTETAPVSQLGAPVFAAGEEMTFQFPVTRIEGGPTSLTVIPDAIGGADYTRHDLIARMGPPFGEMNPAGFQTGWTLEVNVSMEVELYAPLYDGRGAPGMLELEGLDLEPVVAALGEPRFTADDLSALASRGPASFNTSNLPDGWHSIMERKLGPIPPQQRMPESASFGGADGF